MLTHEPDLKLNHEDIHWQQYMLQILAFTLGSSGFLIRNEELSITEEKCHGTEFDYIFMEFNCTYYELSNIINIP